MITLAALLAALSAALQAHPVCRQVTQIETTEFAADQFIIRMRAELTGEVTFQARVYCNRGHVDYAYQLFRDVPLLRWDNKEEFRSIPTFPHHHHDARGGIGPSPLRGDPITDIATVLGAIAQYLSTSQSE